MSEITSSESDILAYMERRFPDATCKARICWKDAYVIYVDSDFWVQEDVNTEEQIATFQYYAVEQALIIEVGNAPPPVLDDITEMDEEEQTEAMLAMLIRNVIGTDVELDLGDEDEVEGDWNYTATLDGEEFTTILTVGDQDAAENWLYEDLIGRLSPNGPNPNDDPEEGEA